MKRFVYICISPAEYTETRKMTDGCWKAYVKVSDMEDGTIMTAQAAYYGEEPKREEVLSDYDAFRQWENEQTLNQAKRDKLIEITDYNIATEVDGFLLNGTRHWLSLEARKAAKLSTDAHITLGHETTEQYLDGKLYTIPCKTLLLMLAQLEVYALQCYNNALRQKTEVEAMTSIEDVQNYDVRNGYPEQLSFNI